jgi:Overcoming lysogenization defect protein-like, TOPRIM domain
MTVILVEGASDQSALLTLAARHDLDTERVSIVPMGGATNIRAFVARFGPSGLGARLAGLCDAGEEGAFRRALEGARLGSSLDRAGMEALGFFVCDADLEDELIRALGVPTVLEVIDAQGELGSFRTLQKQTTQQGRSIVAQLRRFMSSKSGRKLRYAGLLVDALDLPDVPRPLDRVLEYASGAAAGHGLVESLPPELEER